MVLPGGPLCTQASVETIDTFSGLLEWYDYQRQRAEALRRQREQSLEEQVCSGRRGRGGRIYECLCLCACVCGQSACAHRGDGRVTLQLCDSVAVCLRTQMREITETVAELSRRAKVTTAATRGSAAASSSSMARVTGRAAVAGLATGKLEEVCSPTQAHPTPAYRPHRSSDPLTIRCARMSP